jgi:hypothetical protein
MAKKAVAKATETEVTIRRAPRISRFLILGGAVGAVATLIATLAFRDDKHIGYAVLLGYFAVYGIPAGIALGGIVAIILDAISRRRARLAVAERTAVGSSSE